MKFKVIFFLFAASICSYGQRADLVVDLNPGVESGIAEDAEVLGTIGDAIIIDNKTNIIYSDGTAQGTKSIYTLSDSEIVIGEVYLNGELYLAEYASSDTSRIIKVSETGEVAVVLEEAGAMELYVGYKDKLYYAHRSNFTEFLYGYDPQTSSVEEVIELNWFRRDGMKDAIVFNDLIYMIIWPEEMPGSFLATYDGLGNVEILYDFFSSNLDQSSRSTINMTVAETNLYFWFSDGDSESILYVTDGTGNGTLALNSSFRRTARNSASRTIGTIGDKILFEGVDLDGDQHLWRSDGTVDGTFKIEQVADIDIKPRYFTAFQGHQVFCGYHGSQPFSAPSLATLQSDGTLDGTITLLDPDDIPGASISNGFWLTTHNDSLFTVGRKRSFPFDNDLYKSDGTAEGTVKVSTIGDEPGNALSNLTSANNNLFFFGTTDSLGQELYVYKIAAIDEDNDGYAADVDCDDSNPNVNPGQMEEPYNGVDEDCNPATLDDDLDQDGFLLADDCDDANAAINPAADDIPNNDIDEDCDGEDFVSSTHELTNSTIKLYPNPIVDKLHIDIDGPLKFQMNIYSVEGKLLSSLSNTRQVLFTSYKPGIYLIEIRDVDTGLSVVERVVVGK